MEIRKILIVFLFCSVSLFCNCAFAQDYDATDDGVNVAPDVQAGLPDDSSTDNPNDYPKVSNDYGVGQFVSGNFTDGIYYVQGYVVNIYNCKQGNNDGYTQPCKPANVIISDDDKVIDSYREMGGSDLMVYVSNEKEFKVGNKYRFQLKVLNTQSTPQSINDVQAISHEFIQQ